jgi:hypothetical protein
MKTPKTVPRIILRRQLSFLCEPCASAREFLRVLPNLLRESVNRPAKSLDPGAVCPASVAKLSAKF